MYGGNKDMAAWTMIAYPGVRADYLEWVGDAKPYPYGPVSLHGDARVMAVVNKPVDVVIVGFGWTGAIMAIELAQAGLNVLALERGEDRDTVPNWAYPKVTDEIAQSARNGLVAEPVENDGDHTAQQGRPRGSVSADRFVQAWRPASAGLASTGRACIPG